MARYSAQFIRNFFEKGENAETMAEKGRALEDLVCYLFEKVPGILLYLRNETNVFHSEEVDVTFWNDKHPSGFIFLPWYFCVECKNWSRPVGSEQVSWFSEKLRARSLEFGFLIATKGITGCRSNISEANEIIARALSENRHILVLDRGELESLGTTDDLITLTKKKILRLKARRSCL